MNRTLIITIDTEVDKDPNWRISNPVKFSSVTEGVPGILTPLFEKYGVRPTYLISPEVLEDQQSVRILGTLADRDRAELGTHLHAEFIEPQRTRFRHNMNGMCAEALQKQYSADIELEKLSNLTDLFTDNFGFRPTSFRAGRYGISNATLSALASLNYTVDSSVTPGLHWRLKEGDLDFREASRQPHWVETPFGRILELPISIAPASKLSPIVRDLPAFAKRAALKMLGKRAKYQWLRPSFLTGPDMINMVNSLSDQVLVMMLHSTEVICNASPYARSTSDIGRIVTGMEDVFRHCAECGFEFRTMSSLVGWHAPPEYASPQVAACY
jgi:hypothetical protein